MWLECTQKNLRTGLEMANGVISSKVNSVDAKNFLLQNDQGKLKITATDIVTTISIWVKVESISTGLASIPAKLLKDYVGALPEEQVSLELLQNTPGVHITCVNYSSDIHGLDPADFPLPQMVKVDTKIEVSAQDLKSVIKRISFATSKNNSRPALRGVNIDISDSELVIVAADGFRLSMDSIALFTDVKESVGLLVPHKAIELLATAIDKDTETVEIGIVENGNQIIFKFDDIEITSSLIQSEYPNYKRLIPESHATSITLDHNELRKGVTTCSIFVREGSGTLRFISNLQKGLLNLNSSADDVGKNDVDIMAQIEGEDVKIAFNHRYLSELLDNLQADKVTLYTSSSSGPGVFKSENYKNFLHIIMPMYVHW